MRKGESLEGLTNSREKLEGIKRKEIEEKRKVKSKKLGESSKYMKTGRWEVGKSKFGSLRGTRGAARNANTSTSSKVGTGGSRAGSSASYSRRPSGLALKRR